MKVKIDLGINHGDKNSSMRFIYMMKTWMHQNQQASTLIEGFDLGAAFSRRTCQHGGVALWSRKCLCRKCSYLDDLCVERSFEVCGVSRNVH